MSITKYKILSSDLNSFHGTKQKNKSTQRFNLNNNINVNYPNIPTLNTFSEEKMPDMQTDTENPYNDLKTRDININPNTSEFKQPEESEDPKVINDSINFLKLIIKAYEENPIFINKYVICTEEVLEKMIKLLTQCDSVEFEYMDPECTCINKLKTKYIGEILIVKDGKKNNFKYSNVDDYNIIKNHKISLNIVLI